MECVFRHVSCVMATHSVVITAMKPTVLASTVSTDMKITLSVGQTACSVVMHQVQLC